MFVLLFSILLTIIFITMYHRLEHKRIVKNNDYIDRYDLNKLSINRLRNAHDLIIIFFTFVSIIVLVLELLRG